MLQAHLLDIELGGLYLVVQSFLHIQKIANIIVQMNPRSIIDFLVDLHHEVYQPRILLLLQQLLGHCHIATSFEVELQARNGPAFDDGLGETGSFGEVLLALHQVHSFVLLNFVVEGLEQR